MNSAADTPDDLPNLSLLIKLLRLTASSSDQEALLAIRKANEQLAKFGGDWEALLRGRVTILANPFDTIAAPPQRDQTRRPPPPPPPRTAPPPPPRPAPSPTFRRRRAQAAAKPSGVSDLF